MNRRFQFSLKALLWLVALIGVSLAAGPFWIGQIDKLFRREANGKADAEAFLKWRFGSLDDRHEWLRIKEDGEQSSAEQAAADETDSPTTAQNRPPETSDDTNQEALPATQAPR